MLAIINTTLVMADYYMPNASILTDGDTIIDFGKNISIPADAEIIDAGGAFTGPGLIDIHLHAAADVPFAKDPKKCEEILFSHGITTALPTMYFNMTSEEFIECRNIITSAYKKGEFRNFAGFYMEGPYMNPDYGSDRATMPWAGEIQKEEYEPLLKALGADVKVWVVAPERDGVEEFMKDAKTYNPNTLFAVGHSEARPYQIEKLMPLGLKLGTHHTNGTGTQDALTGTRGACVDEAVNYNDNIYAELICDSLGMHVNAYMLRLIAKIKGKNRVILISDAEANGTSHKNENIAPDLVFDEEGGLNGTCLTLDIACRNMMMHTGCSVCDCFGYASKNPAEALGFKDLGKIEIGAKANLAVVDPWFNVKATVFEGKRVF